MTTSQIKSKPTLRSGKTHACALTSGVNRRTHTHTCKNTDESRRARGISHWQDSPVQNRHTSPFRSDSVASLASAPATESFLARRTSSTTPGCSRGGGVVRGCNIQCTPGRVCDGCHVWCVRCCGGRPNAPLRCGRALRSNGSGTCTVTHASTSRLSCGLQGKLTDRHNKQHVRHAERFTGHQSIVALRFDAPCGVLFGGDGSRTPRRPNHRDDNMHR